MSLFCGFSRVALPVLAASLIYVSYSDPASAQSRDIDIDSRADRFLTKITETTKPTPRPPVPVTTLSPAQRSSDRLFVLHAIGRLDGQKKAEPIPEWKATTSFISEPKLGYDTNATNSRNNKQGDTNTTFGGGFQTVFPVEKSDRVILLMSSTSVRYSRLTNLDLDAVLAQGLYEHLLSSDRGSEKTKSSDTAIQKKLSFSIEAKSYHERNYGSLIENYVTPTMTFKHVNFWHADKLCGKKDDESFCDAASFAVSARFNGSGTTRSQYAALKLSAEAVRQTDTEGLVLKASGAIDFRNYTNYSGGRQDVRFTISTGAEWEMSPRVTLAAGVSFIYHASTVSASEWSGFSMGPSGTLKIKLN